MARSATGSRSILRLQANGRRTWAADRPKEPFDQTLARGHFLRELFATIRAIAKWTALAVIALFIYLSINSLAGKSTEVTGIIGVIASLDRIAPWFVSVCALIWGYGEREVRKRTVESMSAQKKALEGRLDPGVTSSNLLSTGETNPEDERKEG